MFLDYFQKNASQHSGASNAPGQSFNCGACALSLTGARLVCFDCDKVVGGCLLLLVPVEGVAVHHKDNALVCTSGLLGSTSAEGQFLQVAFSRVHVNSGKLGKRTICNHACDRRQAHDTPLKPS